MRYIAHIIIMKLALEHKNMEFKQGRRNDDLGNVISKYKFIKNFSLFPKVSMNFDKGQFECSDYELANLIVIDWPKLLKAERH